VLGKFAKDQQAEIDITVAEAVDAVSDWASLGIANAMNRHNPAGEKKE
jgi:peptidyl-tRNA hydrolase